tara:strand:+ start:7301 stop:7726 length:426 start_codon:yes stop_codon:yes gene_type:complete
MSTGSGRQLFLLIISFYVFMDLPKDLTRDIKTRLQSIKGQMEGLVAMLDEGRDPEQILIQFKALQQALSKTHYLLLDETFRKALAIKIVEASDACPGNCGNEDRIDYLLKQFPALDLDELSQKLKEISELRKHLDEFNDQQ